MTRDKRTGRYEHQMVYVGVTTDGHEVGGCETCPKVWVYGDGHDRVYKDLAAFEKAGNSLRSLP